MSKFTKNSAQMIEARLHYLCLAEVEFYLLLLTLIVNFFYFKGVFCGNDFNLGRLV